MAMASTPADATGGSPSETQMPTTPPPARSRSALSDAQFLEKSAFTSPPPLSASMTPPPSTQPVRFFSPLHQLGAIPTDPLLASPPSTVKYIGPRALPTPEAIASAGIGDLRNMVQDLVGAVSDARMSAAHFKLQHSLLTMETEEAAQRAEVEHQMTRREVEVLQAADHRHRISMMSTSRNSQAPPQSQIDILTATCRDLEDNREVLKHRLQRAKKLIEMEKDRTELLVEENLLLKTRIRENRRHFTKLKGHSPIYATPRDAYTTPQRKHYPHFAESATAHEPFAALIAADQLLNGESVSVPSTPTRSHGPKFKQRHTRGAHSLSSLHSTPNHVRPLAVDGFPDPRITYSAPGSQLVNESAERERHDRDSTISISDAEDLSGEDVPQSQASSLATDMLRRNPASQESLRISQNAERTSGRLQSKLFGNVKKAGVSGAKSRKRHGSFNEGDMRAKKAKLSEGVGLGIETWSQA